MRIGFMGGTFSPPHMGHLNAAKGFIREMNLDRLIIIPAGVSPFKVNSMATASNRDRLEMAKLCFLPLDSDKCRVEVSDMEVSKEGTSYTIDTINELKSMYPDDELYMYVGSDMFLSLEKWKAAEDIFAKCIIFTKCREKNQLEAMLITKQKFEKLYNAEVYISIDEEFVVSSSQVREALAVQNFETCRNLLTDKVLGYIIKGGLYFEA